jgi:hypothetical protein
MSFALGPAARPFMLAAGLSVFPFRRDGRDVGTIGIAAHRAGFPMRQRRRVARARNQLG